MAGGEPPLPSPPHEDDAKRPLLATAIFNRHNQGSYLKVVQGQLDGQHQFLDPDSISFKPISQFQGKPSVAFTFSEQKSLIGNVRNVLIGKFSHGRPPLATIRAFFANLHFKEALSFTNFDSKHIFITCSCKTDFVRLWLQLVWNVKGFDMRVFKWFPEFSPTKESSIAPVWVRFANLPLYMFDEMPLLEIANSLGRPIKVDPRNVNRSIVNSARVCIELDVAQPLRDLIRVCFMDEDSKVAGGFWVNVIYDELPLYCHCCSHIGHDLEGCKRKSGMEIVADKVLDNMSQSQNVAAVERPIQEQLKECTTKVQSVSKSESLPQYSKGHVSQVWQAVKNQGCSVSKHLFNSGSRVQNVGILGEASGVRSDVLTQQNRFEVFQHQIAADQRSLAIVLDKFEGQSLDAVCKAQGFALQGLESQDGVPLSGTAVAALQQAEQHSEAVFAHNNDREMDIGLTDAKGINSNGNAVIQAPHQSSLNAEEECTLISADKATTDIQNATVTDMDGLSAPVDNTQRTHTVDIDCADLSAAKLPAHKQGAHPISNAIQGQQHQVMVSEEQQGARLIDGFQEEVVADSTALQIGESSNSGIWIAGTELLPPKRADDDEIETISKLTLSEAKEYAIASSISFKKRRGRPSGRNKRSPR